jgi:hypothetical protein
MVPHIKKVMTNRQVSLLVLCTETKLQLFWGHRTNFTRSKKSVKAMTCHKALAKDLHVNMVVVAIVSMPSVPCQLTKNPSNIQHGPSRDQDKNKS